MIIREAFHAASEYPNLLRRQGKRAPHVPAVDGSMACRPCP